MKNSIRIYLSVDLNDKPAALALIPHLKLAIPGVDLEFWDAGSVPSELYRKKAAEFLASTHLFLAFISVHYLDTPDVRWELNQAIALQKKRSSFQILAVQAKSSFIPQELIGFPLSPDLNDPLEQTGISMDRQLVRVAEKARILLEKTPRIKTPSPVKIDLSLDDLRSRLLPLLDRVDFKPIFDLLKAIAYDAGLLKLLFEAEDAFVNLIQQTRGLKTDILAFIEQKERYKKELQDIIIWLREDELVENWKIIFIDQYYNFQKRPKLPVTPYFFIPTEGIFIPETLHLPGSGSTNMSAEQVGMLSYQQKQDFRRSLLLAQDAIAIENFARAFAHCEHVRNHIDPESAQLYEYLLITYIHNNRPELIIQDALLGEGRMINHTTLFSGRLQRYQQDVKCPTQTGAYNRRVSAEILSDGMVQVYESWPNDYILDTGKRAHLHKDHQEAARRFIEAAQLVYRAVHPMRGALRVLVNELCGGGKFNWISRVVFANDEIRLLSPERFDLESQIHEIIQLIEDVDAGNAEKQTQQRRLLRENLYFSLLAKRQMLAAQMEAERKNHQQFTDLHASVIRFIQACLLGHQMFGERDEHARSQSFLRLALEYLLPELVIDPDPDALFPELRWFDFDTKGHFVPHPDCRPYQFDALAILEKIVRDHAGSAAWMCVEPNIKKTVYLQYIDDTEKMFEQVKQGLSYTDFRVMHVVDARKMLITCLQRWQTAYHVYPESGQGFLDRIITEICGGQLNWLYFSPYELSTHPDALAYGYDAREKLKSILGLSRNQTEESLREPISKHLFHNRILKNWNQITRGDETQRQLAVRLLLECLSAYRLYPDLPFLDFVYQEITLENKFIWIDVDIRGNACRYAYEDETYPFDPVAVLDILFDIDRKRFSKFEARTRIAGARYNDLNALYLREISEFARENRREERAIAIDIIRSMKAIFRFMPKSEYLDLPYRELSGRGRIRWYGMFLGLLPTRDNHFENQFYTFDYRYELFETKRLMAQQFEMMSTVLQETGAIDDPESI